MGCWVTQHLSDTALLLSIRCVAACFVSCTTQIDYVDPNSMEGGNTFSTVPSTATTRRTTGTSAAAPVATAAMLLRNAVAACLASMLLMGLLF